MAEPTTTTEIPVDMLRPGLYVRELDRPWVETPFVFQGFRIATQEELTALQHYCRTVVIDDRRSDPAALATARDAMERASDGGAQTPSDWPQPTPQPTAKRPSTRARQRSVGVLFDDSVNPDRRRFATLVQAAEAARGETQAAADDALRRARSGSLIDTERVEGAVEEMTDRVLEDASAALWLTRLGSEHEDMALHAVNTLVLSLALGAHLEFDRRSLRRLGVGALLHDVGKTALPREILNKTGPLTDEEMARVRQYPQLGHDLVAESGRAHTETLEVIRLHRERWDGHGYPRGLRGETIPRKALIAGLADAYDTMTTARAQGEALSPDKALQELYANAPNEFGVDLVQEFIRCLGIFPVGSVVELDNGARGVVVGARPGGGLWPTILMVRGPDGEPYRKRLLLNLGASPGRSRNSVQRRVARSVETSVSGIDVGRLVAREFGLAA